MSLYKGIIQEDFDFIEAALLTSNSLSLQSYLAKWITWLHYSKKLHISAI